MRIAIYRSVSMMLAAVFVLSGLITGTLGWQSLGQQAKNETQSQLIAYADVEPEETESFLSKVYGGSVGMMVSNLVDRGALSEQEIQELKAILDAAEKEHAQ